MLPHAAAGTTRPGCFGTYNTVATLAGSLGALLALVGSSPQWLLVYPLAAGAGLLATARPLARGRARARARGRSRCRRCTARAGSSLRLSGAVRARQLRRRLRPPDLHRLPVHAQVRRLAADARDRLLRDRLPAGALLPGRRPARRPDRPPAHDGLHATCPPTCCSPRSPSRPTSPPRSRSCSPASRSRRWTSRPGRPTSWPSSTRASAPPPPPTPTPPATSTRPIAPLLAGAALRGAPRRALPDRRRAQERLRHRPLPPLPQRRRRRRAPSSPSTAA